MFETRLARRIFKGFAVLAMLGILGAGALLGSLWLEHRTETTLPTPTGSFLVGRAPYAWAADAHGPHGERRVAHARRAPRRPGGRVEQRRAPAAGGEPGGRGAERARREPARSAAGGRR